MNKILEFEFLRGIAAFYVFFHHTLFQFNIVEKNSLFGKLFSEFFKLISTIDNGI